LSDLGLIRIVSPVIASAAAFLGGAEAAGAAGLLGLLVLLNNESFPRKGSLTVYND